MDSMSLKGICLKPGTRGEKPQCTAGLPVADSVASVRPWKLPSITTTTGSETFLALACRRANFKAASFASAPELQKKARSIPDIEQSFSPNLSCQSILNRLEVCIN